MVILVLKHLLNLLCLCSCLCAIICGGVLTRNFTTGNGIVQVILGYQTLVEVIKYSTYPGGSNSIVLHRKLTTYGWLRRSNHVRNEWCLTKAPIKALVLMHLIMYCKSWQCTSLELLLGSRDVSGTVQVILWCWSTVPTLELTATCCIVN
jgi:hypothetical protein